MSDPARLIFPSFTIGKQDPLEAVNLAKLGVGGFCLYRGTPETVAQIARRLRRAAKYPLLLCADYEEGAWAHVQGSTPLPTNLGMGMAASVEEAREKGRLTAVEARAMGIDWVLAPVLDVLSETKNPIVNVRSFSDDPKRLITFARAYMVGLKRGRALNCLKHFPGHGSTTIDSHLGLPTVTSSRRTLLHRELAPFRGLLAYADAVMLGHLVVPALGDLRRPMTLSEVGPKLLRSWGFRGLITTDALDMGAISKHWGDLEAPLMALKGGADILLVPKDPVRLIQELRRTAGHEPFMSKRCEESIKRLDRALLHTKGARPPLPLVGGQPHHRRAARLFSKIFCWTDSRRVSPIKSVAYFEVQAGPRGTIEGQYFLEGLTNAGIVARVTRTGRAKAGETLIVGLFVGPKAYSGKIALSSSDQRQMQWALQSHSNSIVVSFGSPFVLQGLPVTTAGLCVYSRAPQAQRVAALCIKQGKNNG